MGEVSALQGLVKNPSRGYAVFCDLGQLRIQRSCTYAIKQKTP